MLGDGGAGCDLCMASEQCPSAGCLGLGAGWYWGEGGKVLVGAVSCFEPVLLSS